ncbi:MAG: hypothetical protein QOF51_1843 [Chloroflexota bacterium]|jgi:predicted Zn-dependent peptidase|nr:hypothetical protein [Chloroflexota bacterium]
MRIRHQWSGGVIFAVLGSRRPVRSSTRKVAGAEASRHRHTLGFWGVAFALLTAHTLGGPPAAVQQAAYAAAYAAPAPSAQADDTLQFRLAGETDVLGGASPEDGAAGITLSTTLLNRGATEIAGIELRTPIPADSVVTDVWSNTSEIGPATVERGAVVWSDLAITPGAELGPLFFRVTPAPHADGATIFRHAALQPTASGTEIGTIAAQPLALVGLWGERNLRRTLLPTGLTLFTQERLDTPTVSLRIAVRAGSRDEDDVTRGGSHWLEHAHFLGTARRPTGTEIDAAIEAVGGLSNASTSWEHTDYWHLVPADQFDLALDVLADQMLHSTWPIAEFNRERDVVAEELKLRADTPSTRAFDEFIQAVFQVSPLSKHPSGTIESVSNIPIETILAYREARYVTGNAAIAVAGNVRHDEAVAKIEAAFATFPQGPWSDRPRVVEPVAQAPRRLIVGDGTRAATVRLGWPAPGDTAVDSAPMYVLEDILGATGRRLVDQIRDERGLASSISADYYAFSDAGALSIGASTRPDQVNDLVAAIMGEIQRVRAGDVTADEIETSLRALAGRRALDEETNQAQTARADSAVAGTLESYDEYIARLRRVTPTDVQDAAQRYLDPQNYTLVVVQL